MKDKNNKQEIPEFDYNYLYLSGSRPGISYGLTKVRKPFIYHYRSLWPIFPAINSPKYKLAVLTPLTSNQYTLRDSFSFAKEVASFDSARYRTSFDSLFTNILLRKTIKIYVVKFWNSKTRVYELSKESF